MILQTKLLPLSEIIGRPVYYVDRKALDQYIDEVAQFLKEVPSGVVSPVLPGTYFKTGVILDVKQGLVSVNGYPEKVGICDIVSPNFSDKQLQRNLKKTFLGAIRARLYHGRPAPLEHQDKPSRAISSDLYAYDDPLFGDQY